MKCTCIVIYRYMYFSISICGVAAYRGCIYNIILPGDIIISYCISHSLCRTIFSYDFIQNVSPIDIVYIWKPFLLVSNQSLLIFVQMLSSPVSYRNDLVTCVYLLKGNFERYAHFVILYVPFYIKKSHFCIVCMCVCVHVCERDWEREYVCVEML